MKGQLEAWLHATRTSKAELSRKAGIDRGTLYRYINGRSWTSRTQAKLAAAFGVTEAEFVAGPSPDRAPQRESRCAELPLYESIPAGAWAEICQQDPESTYPVALDLSRAHRVVVRAFGESMWSTIWDHDLLLVDCGRHSPVSGDIVIARTDSQWTLKRWRKVRGEIILTADNSREYQPLVVHPGEQLEVLGIVVGLIWRDLTKVVA